MLKGTWRRENANVDIQLSTLNVESKMLKGDKGFVKGQGD
jgi:hypothetical protein